MSFIALFADKGSPGVTSLCLTLAAVWPRPVLLAELDPAGGDLALRLTDATGTPVLPGAPGLLSLAADCRSGDPAQPWRHARPLPFGHAAVLPGLINADQGAAMTALWPAVASALVTGHTPTAGPSTKPDAASESGSSRGDVLADLGRLHPGSPALVVAERADLLLGVGRADPASMVRLRDRIEVLLASLPAPDSALPRRFRVVLVADDRCGDEAVTAMRTVLRHAGLPAEVAGFLALDQTALADLQSGRFTARTDRSLLVRSARTLLPALTGDLTGAVSDALPADGRMLASVRRRIAPVLAGGAR